MVEMQGDTIDSRDDDNVRIGEKYHLRIKIANQN